MARHLLILVILSSAMIGILSMSGCAVRPESRCSSSWEELGFLDGRLGRPAESIRKHPEACTTSSGATADREAYLRGREAGLTQYCTGHSGFFVGRTNGSYQGVCASRDEGSFLNGLRQGRELRHVNQRLDEIAAAIAKIDEPNEKARRAKDRAALEARRVELLRVQGELVATRERIESETERL